LFRDDAGIDIFYGLKILSKAFLILFSQRMPGVFRALPGFGYVSSHTID
jgi:hypothetical protein